VVQRFDEVTERKLGMEDLREIMVRLIPLNFGGGRYGGGRREH